MNFTAANSHAARGEIEQRIVGCGHATGATIGDPQRILLGDLHTIHGAASQLGRLHVHRLHEWLTE